MNHVVTYFGPKEGLSKQKRYLRYNIEKPHKLTTRKYVGLVRDLNSRMAQLPPLFEDSQKLDESELVDFLANTMPRTHKSMLIAQVSILRPQILRHLWNTASAQTPLTTLPGQILLPQTRTVSQGRKSASSPKTIMVRNSRTVLPSCIALFMGRIPVSPPRIATSSSQKSRKSLSSPRRTTRRIRGKSISWRNKPLIKGKSNSSTRSSTRRFSRKRLLSF